MVYPFFVENLRCPRARTVIDQEGRDHSFRNGLCARRVDVQVDCEKRGGTPTLV